MIEEALRDDFLSNYQNFNLTNVDNTSSINQFNRSKKIIIQSSSIIFSFFIDMTN